MRYEIINYDVWGNETDGYAVNDAFRSGQFIEIADNATDAEIIATLIDADYLKEHATTKNITIDGEPGYSLYLQETDNHYPICELRQAHE